MVPKLARRNYERNHNGTCMPTDLGRKYTTAKKWPGLTEQRPNANASKNITRVNIDNSRSRGQNLKKKNLFILHWFMIRKSTQE